MIPASPWRRLAAYLVDYLLFVVPLLGVLALAGWLLRAAGIDLFSGAPWRNQAVAFLGLTVPLVLYFAGSEAAARQGTWGKRLLGLAVVDERGERPSFRRTLDRAAVKFLPWEYFHTILWQWDGWPTQPAPPTPGRIAALTVGWLAIGWYLASLFLGSGRTPYDRVSGTRVVRSVSVHEPGS